MKSVLVLLFLALSVNANHIAYLNYYDESSCDGAVLATIPIFPGSTGDTILCAIPNTNDCVTSLSGILAGSGSTCDLATYNDDGAQDDDEIFLVEDGETSVRFFGNCIQSATFGGCYLSYSDNMDPITLDDDENTSIVDDDDLVGFISYHGDSSCTSTLEFRAPVPSGSAEFCVNSGATTCSGDLRGVTLPRSTSGLSCTTNSLTPIDECSFLETENSQQDELNYGVCTQSSIFPNCRFEYSNNYGTTDQCENDDDDVVADDDDNNDDDDIFGDDDDDNNNDDDSSSGAVALVASSLSVIFAFLI